jgi:hypothetical protein
MPAPFVPEQAKDLATLYGEINPGERANPPVGFHEAFRLDRVSIVHLLSRSRLLSPLGEGQALPSSVSFFVIVRIDKCFIYN